MEAERTKFSYTSHSVSLAAASASAAVCVIFGFFILINQTIYYPYHGKPDLDYYLIFWAFGCCFSYLAAAVLINYSQEFWQRYIPAYLAISLTGSTIFSLCAVTVYYLYMLGEAGKYNESVAMFDSASSPFPSFPTQEKLVFVFLISTVSLSLFTGMATAVADELFPEKKEKENYTFLNL